MVPRNSSVGWRQAAPSVTTALDNRYTTLPLRYVSGTAKNRWRTATARHVVTAVINVTGSNVFTVRVPLEAGNQ